MTPDFDKIADTLERFATLLRTRGREAWRNAKDWQSPLKSPDGPAAAGSVSRPTETVAIQRAEGHDRLAEQYPRLRQQVEVAYDMAVDGTATILLLVGTSLPENDRAGIGWCACGRYCDGQQNNRLRSGQCPACDTRARRQQKAG